MKVKWKITNWVAALFALLVSVSSLFLLSKNMVPNVTSPSPDLEPPRQGAGVFDKVIDQWNRAREKHIDPIGDIIEGQVKKPIDVDRLLDEMEFGAIAFNAPTNINIDESHQIQLILSLAETAEELKQSITEEGEKVGAAIKISDRMEARLSGYMFQITVITPEVQAVSKSQQTEWK